MARHCRNLPLLGEQQRNPRVWVRVVGAQAAHNRSRLKHSQPRIANRDSPAQPTPPLLQDIELDCQPECRMFLQRLLHLLPADFKVLQFIPVVVLRCEARQTLRLNVCRNRRDCAGLASENHEKFSLRQNRRVTERGSRDVGIGRRKQHHRLRLRFRFRRLRR